MAFGTHVFLANVRFAEGSLDRFSVAGKRPSQLCPRGNLELAVGAAQVVLDFLRSDEERLCDPGHLYEGMRWTAVDFPSAARQTFRSRRDQAEKYTVSMPLSSWDRR